MASEEDKGGVSGKAIQALAEIAKVAVGTPEMKETGREVGRSLLTVAKLANNCLLPIAAINFGMERARKYFTERFEADYKAAAANIPEENLTEPKASIVGPALQNLACAFDEESLKNMYLKLIASASDNRKSSPHPAYAHVISQLSAEEAFLFKTIFVKGQSIQELVSIGVQGADGAIRDIARDILPRRILGQPLQVEGWESAIESAVRLGLAERDYMTYSAHKRAYEWVDERPEIAEAKKACGKSESVFVRKGVFRMTEFGKGFVDACDIKWM